MFAGFAERMAQRERENREFREELIEYDSELREPLSDPYYNCSPYIMIERTVITRNPLTGEYRLPDWDLFARLINVCPELLEHYKIVQSVAHYLPEIPAELDDSYSDSSE